MRRTARLLALSLSLILVFAFAETSRAQVPAKVSYQGLLTDDGGKLVQDGTYRVTFRLYGSETGGEPLWNEAQQLPVTGGLFSTMIGSVEALSLPFDQPYFLTIEIEGQAESERLPLSAVPYSLVARDVAPGSVVRSLSGMRDDVEIVAGEGISIERQDNRLVISARVGLGQPAARTPVELSAERMALDAASEQEGEPSAEEYARVLGPGGSNVGLDAAYDAGNTITADTGPVQIQGTGGISFRALNGDLLFEDAAGGAPNLRFRVSGGAFGVQEWRFNLAGANGRLTLRNQTSATTPLVVDPTATNNVLQLAGNDAIVRGLRVTTGAAAGNVLMSDAIGNATWQPAPGGLPPAGTVGDVLRNTGPGAGNWSSAIHINEATPFVGVHRSNRIGSEYFGVHAPVGPNTYGGMYINANDAGGWPFYGYATAGAFRAWTYYDGTLDNWNLVNSGVRLTIDNDGHQHLFDSIGNDELQINPTGTSGGSEIELYDDGVLGVEILADEGGTSPAIKLYNAGVAVIELDANLSGDGRIFTEELQITGGSDLSENFDVNGAFGIAEPLPGMVVSIDPEHAGRLAVSGKAYDRMVAGVVSGAGGVETGLIMAQRGTEHVDGQFPVALTGRVYVWVDAAFGSVQPGDLLTTSATPGHAMKVGDYAQAQGAVIGKAMTALPEGRGLVLVLVSLQ